MAPIKLASEPMKIISPILIFWKWESKYLEIIKWDVKFVVIKLLICFIEKLFRGPGQSIKIPLGAKHRAWNETDELVQFIEVQTGTYFGEDDIIRIEDDYMRSDDVQEFLELMDQPGPWSEEDDKIYTIGGLSNDKEGSFMEFVNKQNKKK